MAIIAVAPTTEPEERSMPPVMITWVTPTAMMPTTLTCRIMMLRRWVLKRKLCPWRSQPSTSKISAIAISPKKMLSSGGRWPPRVAAGRAGRCAGDLCHARSPAFSEVAAPPRRRRRQRDRLYHEPADPAGHQFFDWKSAMFAGVTSWNGM